MTYLQIVILSVTAAVGTTIGLWLGDTNPSTEVVSAHALGPVQPGGTLQIGYRVNRFRPCPRSISREVIDGEGVRHQLGEQVSPSPGALGYDEYIQPVHVPAVVIPGEGKYRVIISEYCNPLRRFWPSVRVLEIPILIAWGPSRNVMPQTNHPRGQDGATRD